jgi:fumarate reductase subunit D
VAGRRRAAEPILWLLFSAGGVVSALFLPVLMVLFALAIPLGWLSPPAHGPLLSFLGNPLVALVLFGVFVLSLFHWAQRFRYTLFDGLMLKAHQRAVNTVVYAVAVVGSVWAAVVLVQVVAAR